MTVTINPINDAPVINLASTIQINENQTAVASDFISDADRNDSLSLSISGNDADSFNLSADNVLTFKIAPDYESDKKSYSIILTLTDGIESVSKNITINILNVNDIAPVIKTPSNISSPENQNFIIEFNAIDVEGDEISFRINDFDFNDFNISSKTGSLSFKSLPDFESKNTYKINLTASDGTNITTKEIIITVTNIEENNFGDCRFGTCKFGT